MTVWAGPHPWPAVEDALQGTNIETHAQYCKRRGLDGEIYDYLIEPTARGGAGVPADIISVVEF